MKLIAGLLGLLLVTASIQAQERATDDHYRTMITEFIDAMNSADEGQRETCLRAHYLKADTTSHRERWQGHLRRFHGELGFLKIESIAIDYPEAVRAICHSESERAVGEWVELSLILATNLPEKFWSMSVEMVPDPDLQLPQRPLTTEEIAEYVKQFVERMVQRDVFSGTVLLARDGKPFFSGAWGHANLRWMIPNQLDTKFNLGSMNKMFTGVAIGQLVEQGQLSFDDYIIDHLPDYPNLDLARRVQIHHLLTHTSGMDSYWDAMAEMDWTALRSVRDFADLTIGDTLLFEPGERFNYSNSGPLILGLIIEKVTGMDYHDYIRERVAAPAGMINTDCYHNDHPVPNLALGYFWAADDDTMRTSNIFEHSARGSAAGGGYSTVGDLLRFANALYDGRLLSAELVDTLTTGKIKQGPESGYAYLFGDSNRDGHRAVGHGGGAPGINADLKIFPDIGFTVAAMSNYDEGASAIVDFAVSLITHQRPVPVED